jgi:hypothetical protein
MTLRLIKYEEIFLLHGTGNEGHVIFMYSYLWTTWYTDYSIRQVTNPPSKNPNLEGQLPFAWYQSLCMSTKEDPKAARTRTSLARDSEPGGEPGSD